MDWNTQREATTTICLQSGVTSQFKCYFYSITRYGCSSSCRSLGPTATNFSAGGKLSKISIAGSVLKARARLA